MVFLPPWMDDFLDENPKITNRMACIVRSFLKVEYLKPTFTVFAALGIQLIEPFYSATIAKGATHSQLKIFYQTPHDQLSRNVTEDFFTFKEPWFDCVPQNLFDAVKASYSKQVVEAIESVASEYLPECITLCNFILPELKVVLGRQRRDYGISKEFPAQYPVEKQASKVDETPRVKHLCQMYP